jgi:hypothetical protein
MQRAGVAELLRDVHELGDAWVAGDYESAGQIVRAITDELERQRRALEREAGKEAH